MRARRKASGLPIGEALDPVTLVAVAVVVMNDWWAKRAIPGWWTGKVSDVAGLVAAPLVLTALVDLVLWLGLRAAGRDPAPAALGPRRLAAAIALVGAVFAAVKLSPAAAQAVARVWPGDARLVPDPTDLIALPALAIAAVIGRRHIH